MLVRTDRPLVYLHATIMPHPVANSVQVVSMCESFGRLHPDVRLAAFFKSDADIWSHYGVEETFRLLPLHGRQTRGLTAAGSVAAVMRRFGRNWSCYTRIPAVAAATTCLRIPTILEVHAIPEAPRHRRAIRFSTARSSLLRVVVISERLSVTLVEEGLARSKEVVVAHDAATARSTDEAPSDEGRDRFGLPRGVPLVGYAGSLKTDKGVGVLLSAVASHPTAQVAIAGAYPEAAYKELRAVHQGPRVHFIGQLRPADVRAFLMACDVIAGPFVPAAHRVYRSFGATRTTVIHDHMSPLKMFEAFAANRPLVVSDLPVLREVIEPERNCLAVPPGDVTALRDAISRLIDDPSLGARLASGARATLEAHTWDRRAVEILGATVTR